MKKNYDVVILAGGLGRRLKKILKGIPKPLVRLNKNILFLDLILSQLSNLDVNNIFISISKSKEEIFKEYLKLRNYKNISLVVEKKKLDTGGAIKNVIIKKKIRQNFICVNGDTNQNLKIILKKLRKLKKNNFDYIFLTKSAEKKRYGNVLVKSNKVISFLEKQKTKKSFVSTGVYFLNKKNFLKITKKRFSLENFYFNSLIKKNKLNAIILNSKFFDIGTYQSLEKFKKNYIKIRPKVLLICRINESYSDKIKKLLQRHSVDLNILYSKKLGEKINSKYFSENYDYIFSFRNYFILKSEHLMKSKISINFHPSTPKYRGSGGINYSLMNKDKKFGVTTHFMNSSLDNGPIISVKYFDIKSSDNLRKLLSKTHKMLFKEAKKYINLILLNKIDLMKAVKLNSKIKWSKKINNIDNLNRLYKIPQNINKTKLNLIIKSTLINNYRPYKLINNKKIFYE